MKSSAVRTTIIAIASTLSLGGCGGARITPELRTARETIEEARRGTAAALEPRQLRLAELTLTRAEAAPDGSREERDLAYVADRQARIAIARAALRERTRAFDEAQHRSEQERELDAIEGGSEADALQSELAQIRDDLARVRAELARADTPSEAHPILLEREARLAAREARLAAVLAARADAEQRAHSALARLETLATVSREAGETIVTIPGEVLFERNQAELRPAARRRLRAVAEVLAAQPTMHAAVEDYGASTDGVGATAELSQRRAESVRQFLVDEGIEMSRVRAIGRGRAEPPVAESASAEGSARRGDRIEIHLGRPERPHTDVPQGRPNGTAGG